MAEQGRSRPGCEGVQPVLRAITGARTFPPIIKAAPIKKIFFTIYCPSSDSPKGGWVKQISGSRIKGAASSPATGEAGAGERCGSTDDGESHQGLAAPVHPPGNPDIGPVKPGVHPRCPPTPAISCQKKALRRGHKRIYTPCTACRRKIAECGHCSG